MLAPLGLDHSYTANGLRSGGASLPASRVSAAVKYCSAQVAALIFGSRDARLSRALSPFRKAEPTFTAVASARKIIWVRPDDIVFKLWRSRPSRRRHSAGRLGPRPGARRGNEQVQVDLPAFSGRCPWEDTVLFGKLSKPLSSRRAGPRGTACAAEAPIREEGRSSLQGSPGTGFRIARDLWAGPPISRMFTSAGAARSFMARGEIIVWRWPSFCRSESSLVTCAPATPIGRRSARRCWTPVALTKDGAPSNAHAAFMGHWMARHPWSEPRRPTPPRGLFANRRGGRARDKGCTSERQELAIASR